MTKAARNTVLAFGWITRLIHWAMALGILAMLGLGTYIHEMEPSLSNLWLYGLHKTIGVVLLMLALIRLLWHWINPPPKPLGDNIADWQIRAARTVHFLLYAFMVAIPVTGWIASAATGLDVVIFRTITLPTIAPTSEHLEDFFFLVHGVLTKSLMVLLVLHISGALHRHFILADSTMRRMIRG